MKLKEKINDLKFIFNVIKWYKENSHSFMQIKQTLININNEIATLKDKIEDLTSKGNK
jgi:hypothetical protein